MTGPFPAKVGAVRTVLPCRLVVCERRGAKLWKHRGQWKCECCGRSWWRWRGEWRTW